MCLASELEKDSGRFLVWYLTDRKFKELYDMRGGSVDWERVDWNAAFSYARSSRTVLFKFCQESLKNRRPLIESNLVSRFELVIKEGSDNLQLLRKTLTTIKDLWDGEVDYYIIKTRDDRPTGDADVLFTNAKDYESAVTIAREKGYKFNREEPFKGWIAVRGGVKIELHNGLSWFGMKVFDEDFLASDPQETSLMNLRFITISKKVEPAIEIAHWILDIQPIGIVTFSNLVKLVENCRSWDEIELQAKKYSWLDQLRFHLSLLKKLCAYIYCFDLVLPIELQDVPARPCFPYWVPAHIKIPFMSKKVLQDNEGCGRKLNMLQLALRRYAWAKLAG